MRRLFGVGFWGIVAAQILLLVAIIGGKEYTLNVGTTVVLQTVPVDPRSLLQGDFAILGYKISTLPSTPEGWPPGSTVYVSLVDRGEVWEALRYSIFKKPSSDEVFIKGTVDRSGMLDFGIGTYFVPEGTGGIIERARDVKVEVVVDSRGNAVIKRVLVDGVPFDPKQELNPIRPPDRRETAPVKVPPSATPER
ncbi:MAG: GDYXXLXY domain-containing protein [Chloroflexi bacterium]|nr:GDYXXLXY domain-containing protein [Chloroflexota bacterium]